MALSTAIVFEVRQTGSDTNGGGFVAGAAGTDWSLQDAAQYSVTDAVTAGTTTITSATAAFGTDVVGNLAYVQGGTGSVAAGWYQVISRTSATAIVVDRSTGLTSGTGVTLKIGGALATIAAAAAVAVGSNKIFVRYNATPYQTAATITLAQAVTPSNTAPQTRLIGYCTTRGDCTVPAVAAGTVTRPTLQLITNTGLTGLSLTGSGWIIENLIIDCNSLGTSSGIVSSQFYHQVQNCLVKNFKTFGISLTGAQAEANDNEVTGGAGTAGINLTSTPSRVLRNHVHANACPGINCITGSAIAWNLVVNNTGSASDGIVVAYSSDVSNNTVSGNGRHGILFGAVNMLALNVKNNVLANHTAVGAAGLKFPSAGNFATLMLDGNGYYNNTSHRVNADDTGGTNAINAVAPYTNALDVVCSADPFTNAAGGDFTLNTTAGGGAALRAAGSPGVIPGVAQIGKLDMGCFQHADPAGGGTTTYVINQVRNMFLFNEPEP